jgi:hypothetical protein
MPNGTTRKILGFIVDGLNWMVRILAKKVADIIAKIKKILNKKQAPLEHYRHIVGKLQYFALIMSSTQGLFSPLSKVLKGEPATIGLGRNSKVQAALLDMANMVAQLGSRPTHIKELVPDDDHYVVYCDACNAGASGVWFSGDLHFGGMASSLPNQDLIQGCLRQQPHWHLDQLGP